MINLKKRYKYAGDVFNELLKAGWDLEVALAFVNNIPDADIEKDFEEKRIELSEEKINDMYIEIVKGGGTDD